MTSLLPRFRRAAVVALTGAVLGASSCGYIGRDNGVILLGDSLTVLVSPEVIREAGTDYDVVTEADMATWGLQINELLDEAAKVKAIDPDQVVVNLGTNNVLKHHDPVGTEVDLGALLDQLGDIRCVHLVTLNEDIHPFGESFRTEAAALNVSIRKLAASRDNIDVIDWNRIILEHPTEQIISTDTVHPNPAGVKLLAKAYMKAIRAC